MPSGSGSGSSSSSGTSGEMTCAMPQVDGSAIGQDCARSDCPDGYDCIEHGGFQVQYLCGVLCDDECLCPEDHTCMEFNIKGVVHSECVP